MAVPRLHLHLSCRRPRRSDRRDERPAPGHPLASLTSTDFHDLEFLKVVLKNKRLVQLGENGHGEAEAMLIRARLARFLHQELGFNVLAFESSLFLGHHGDQRAGTAEPKSTLIGSTIGVWHTEEVLPLFEYVRETRGSARPLRLAGFDIQPIGSNKKHRPGFFSRLVALVDVGYARVVAALDSSFLSEYDKGSASRRR